MTDPRIARRLLITRCREDFEATRALAAAHGLESVPYPLIRREPLVIGPVAPGDWAVFTSPAAVRLWPRGDCPGKRLACVGEGTARAAHARGWEVSFIPTEARGEALGRELPAAPGDRVVFAVGEQGGVTLRNALTARGFTVDRMNLYRTVGCPPPASPRIVPGLDFHGILFMSPSAVAAWVKFCHGMLGSARVLVIGPTTAKACGDAGMAVHFQVPAGNLDLLLKNYAESP